ncbi:MAG: thioredoxin [Candidatus Doudnabacteria bacterium]|nr:thioredoxin [Candidatus Doudnabacteria bacterium]
MSGVKLDEQNFEKEALQAEMPVLVDFWAEWCGPCKALSPIVEELANEYQGKLKVASVNVDENNSLAMRYGVMSIPSLKFFKNGKVVAEMVGAQPKSNIVEVIKTVL